MFEKLLRLGSRGPDVIELQKQLNAALDVIPPLQPDGIFGSKTDAAVRKFQADTPPLGIDGIVGPKTLAQLVEVFQRIRTGNNKIYLFPYRPAPRIELCWATATGMVVSKDTTAVFNQTPQHMKEYSGLLTKYEKFDDGYSLGVSYAAVHRLICLRSERWPADKFRGFLLESPVIVDRLYSPPDGSTAYPGHWMVVVGFDGAGSKMRITIWDPMPAGAGRLLTANYDTWIDANRFLIGRAFIRQPTHIG